MYGYIYLTENIINGMCYIGKHKSNQIDLKYYGSSPWLKRSIKKYGKDNFIITIIEWCNSEDELNSREMYWIDKCNAIENNSFYNLTPGGKGGWDYVNSSIEPYWRGKSKPIEQREKESSTKKKNFSSGKTVIWNKGKTKYSDDRLMSYSLRQSKRLKGKKLSQSHIENIRSSMTGIKNPFYGKKHTQETRDLISKAKSIPIRCIETGCEYTSSASASKILGIDVRGIRKCCKGDLESYKGLHFKFI